MNLREEFLKSVEEDSPETFLRFIEQHVSKVHSYLEDRLLNFNNMYQLACLQFTVLIFSKNHPAAYVNYGRFIHLLTTRGLIIRPDG